MHRATVNRGVRIIAAALGVILALLIGGPSTGPAHASAATPVGDAISIGDPNALKQIDLYVDPLCPYSGKFIRAQGDEMAKRIENGSLRVNLRFVNFLEKYSATGTYDIRAIYAAFVVAGQSQSSDVTWRFVQQIFSADQQPKEKGPTDLSDDQLAELAGRVGAPQAAQDLIRFGLPIGFDPHAIAANNLSALHDFPEAGVPLVVINGQPVDGDSDWLGRLAS
ncbi:MAG: thioredoxin domain-containing protein [Mycobacterium sp.]|nr:thioredoxin domain-containing protein [Mycobacterium sp.]